MTYKAPLTLDLVFEAVGSQSGPQSFAKRLGSIPIMTKSAGCYLRGLDRAGLIAAKEESTEFGGYFICNGIERIIRMLILQVGMGLPLMASELCRCKRAPTHATHTHTHTRTNARG